MAKAKDKHAAMRTLHIMAMPIVPGSSGAQPAADPGTAPTPDSGSAPATSDPGASGGASAPAVG